MKKNNKYFKIINKKGGFNEGSYMSYLTAEGSGAIAKKIRNNILRKSNVR